MKTVCRLRLALSILAVHLFLVSYPALSFQIAPEDAKNIMRVSQVKRGMRGYGLTVFQGTKIEKFDLEILGVLPKMNTGKDLILVRIGGGPITARGTGIIAGMSGSPCYVSGKLIGAIAYGSSFNKEPVGMITPIEDMLEAWDKNLPDRPSGYSSPQSLPNPLLVDGREVSRIAIDGPGEANHAHDSGTLWMRPLMTPLMVTGLSPRSMEKLREVLRPFAVEPMAGPGTPVASGIKATIEPGSAVGVALARGDIDMSGVGTVTYRRGNRILAFGHPMLGIGAIDAPMTTAYVADIMSRLSVSTKMAVPLESVGRLFQDRPWSVAGAVGSASKTIPATIRVDDEAYRRSKVYRVNVINHPLLASGILTTVVSEAVYQMHPSPGDATAEVAYEVTVDQIGKISRKNVFFDATSIDSSAVRDMGSFLALVSANRFQPLDIQSINVNVRIQQKRDTAAVDRIFVKKSEFEPGETIEVGVVLRPYKKDRVTKTFEIKVPATAPDGRMVLQVRGGASPAGLVMPTESDEDSGPVIGSSIGAEMATADNVRQLVDKYLEREKNNELVLRLIMRGTAVNVNGEKLTGLPNAIADIMKSSRNSGLRLERDEAKQIFDAGTIVYGSAQVSVNVKRKDLKETKPGPKPISAPEERVSESSISSSDDSEELMYSMVALQAEVISEEESDESEDLEDEEEDLEDTAEESEEPAAKDEKPDTAAAKPSDSKKDVKTVVRQAKTWAQMAQADFAKGEFSGVAASSKNALELAPTVRKLAETPEQFVWTVSAAKDGVYAGTGNSGRIYHITDGGEVKLFFETGQLEVHSLALDSAGNLYAGTSPRGRVFRVSPDGTGKELWKADERYVLALAIDSEDNLYAGMGDSGNVYRIHPDGSARVFAAVNEQQILSLHRSKDGSLIIGTGINGVVYKADSAGRAVPIFDADEEAVSSVTSDSKGNVYAGTSPKGVVYKIAPDLRSKAVLTKASRVLALAVDGQDNIFAVSDGNVMKITPDEVILPLDSAKDKAQFLSLAYNSHTETLYAGTGNIGSVYAGKCSDKSGVFESAVHDTGMISRWSRVKWVAQTPEGATVELRSRTGNVPTPDATWSGWSQPYSNSMGEQIAGPDARYIQYQVSLKTGKPDVSPKVSSVSISYMTPNQAPKVTITAPKGGAVWAGKKTVTWTGSDPDKDTLTYDGYYSTDGGKEWKVLFGGIRGDGENGTPKKSEEEIKAKIKTELEKSKDVPEEMKKQLLQEDSKERSSATRPAPGAGVGNGPSSSKTSHELDTTKLTDGLYLLKIVASDKSSNAVSALTGEYIGEAFVICNKPPKLNVFKSGIKIDEAGRATITGSAVGALADIVGVQYRVDGGAWVSAAPDDGMFDSPEERFTVVTDVLASGTRKVEVQAVDAAGNASSETVEVKTKQPDK